MDIFGILGIVATIGLIALIIAKRGAFKKGGDNLFDNDDD